MGEAEQKAVLKQYLQRCREDLVWKLDGVGERDARLPRTPTGTSMLGVVKHCLNVEAQYFGPTFGRELPWPGRLVALEEYDADPQVDWYATEDETKDGLLELYREVAEFCDQTIDLLPLDAPGRVPWWPPERPVTLHGIAVHVVTDLARHAGHLDILRERLDGRAGLRAAYSNLPEGYDWAAYTEKLTAIADGFVTRPQRP